MLHTLSNILLTLSNLPMPHFGHISKVSYSVDQAILVSTEAVVKCVTMFMLIKDKI